MQPGRLGPTLTYLLIHNCLGPVHGILSDLSEAGAGQGAGQQCEVAGRGGVCTYSMLCTFARGEHLGTCRDRFIFGSCCRLPAPDTGATPPPAAPPTAAVEAEQDSDWEEVERVCGRRRGGAATRIQGGEVAARTAWPWQAGLRLVHGGGAGAGAGTSHHCGAVLLGHRWAATAAHCVYKKSKRKLVLVLGDFNNRGEAVEEGEERRGLREVVIHPEYRHSNYDNDIALLQLDTPVTFNKYILPICLPPPNLNLTGKTAFVTGWGRIYEGGPQPDNLIEVDVPVLSNSECNNMFKLAALDEHVSEEIWVCAGYRDGGKDACDGDSGGPLSVEDPVTGAWQLGGIISWGPNSCGEKLRPGVYTRVPSYTGWIRGIVSEEREKRSQYREGRTP